ncbi:unnamed protein product [Didymodactylos carnosus]|uniref:Uncharacterized protein n=1 Tax=Didymodactylos carnosus TaxID=1234261 RepID=A0A814ZZ42_9BILA|nr:unnamed protein product [Didymodactylos carnosus]CAF1249851.1 unnamed protein product [Didymodactylos carnosus]CAF3655220.1 unnamed protein product [Didymodactylos carnosus]CAF4018471.1 unnamed protein product [Didymodactylos carnosus]
MSHLQLDKEYHYLFKILIIGDSGIGKTSILQRFANDYFAPDYVATIGVDFQIRTIDIDSKDIKLQVWDTAGQDRFKCIVSSFYRGANGVLVCFDITNIESFRNVDTWIDEIQRYCPENTPIYLVGTKSDLHMNRTITYQQAKQYAETRRIQYIETSAKTNDNVQMTFFHFAKMIMEHSDKKLDDVSNGRLRPIIGMTHAVQTPGSSCNGSSCSIK